MRIKIKRRICATISALSLFIAYCIVGGIQFGTISLGVGSILLFSLIAVFGFTAYKGGYMR